MNLQESIRRILREKTEYVKDVRVKISDILKTNRDGQSLDDAIVNVQDGLKSYSEGPPFLLKIGDKYEVLDGFHRIAQKILDGKKYIISDVMIKESNMNLQENIKRILREETEMLTNLTQLRRRTYLIDNAIQKILQSNTEIYGEGFLYKLIHRVQVWLHGQNFVYSELPDEEWEKIKEFIKYYIEKKYKG